MNEKGVSVGQLSRMTGISRQTIYDWQKKNTNPGADKIMIICETLQITPEELLVGVPADTIENPHLTSSDDIEIQIAQNCREMSEAQKKRLLAYASMLLNN